MLDVHLPTSDDRTVILSRYTQPGADLQVLLQELKLGTPARPPPKITASGRRRQGFCSEDLVMRLGCFATTYDYLLPRIREVGLEVFWLLRGLTPDLKTIADFRKDNRGAFKLVFRQFVLLCRKLELFGGGRFEAFSTDVKDRSRKSRFSTFEWRSEFFIACGYSISWES